MGKILVVDDDEAMRRTIFRLLRRAGHEVVMAEDGREGVSLFRAAPADLVITDLYMPDKDGLETLCELHREFPDVAVIAICGNRNWELMLKAAKGLGAVRTLEKPFDPEMLVGMVAEELERLASKSVKPSERHVA